MSVHEPVEEMLLRWEAGRASGSPPTVESLCAEHPDLTDELRRRIRAIEEMEAILGVHDSYPVPAQATIPADLVAEAPVSDATLPVLPGYRMIRIVGQGGMGVVYEAVQLELGRTVAVKMISGPRLDERLIARFRAEAGAAARLQHPNVLQVFEVGQVREGPFYSMEYAAGGTLAQRIAHSPLPWHTSAELVETLARAVHAAHESGIVHRDLKPANVMLTTDGVPKIADFGLAKLLDTESGHTQTGEILGTPSYMAPEQAEGKRAVGPPADVYALGAILYDLLTRQPPFQGTNALDTLLLVTTRDPVPPSKLVPGVPPDLEAICLKCLEKEPARRYTSARNLAEDLRRFLSGQPVQARRLGWLGKTWRWMRRHPREVALGLLLLILVAIPIYSVWSDYRATRQRTQRAEQAAPLAREILSRNCYECHDGSPLDGKKNFDALSHPQLLDAVRRFVVPGSPERSRLLTRIADGSMPPEEQEVELPRLTETEVTILHDWIAGGAPPFSAEDPEFPTPPVVPYSALAAEARTILHKHCYECHKYDVAKGGIKILHHRLLVSVRKVVVPGRPDASELIHTLTAPEDFRMPPAGYDRLSERDIATLRRWVTEGAPGFPREQ